MRARLHKRPRPTGIQVRLKNEDLAAIPDAAVQRTPSEDRDGCAAWLVVIPQDLDIKYPPEIRIATIPARTIAAVAFDNLGQ